MIRVLVALALTAALTFLGSQRCVASPVLLSETELRPHNGAEIRATTGIVTGYKLIATNSLVSTRLTIWDQVSQASKTFVLTFKTKINDKPFSCMTQVPQTIPQFEVRDLKLCSALPKGVVVGRTRVVVLYWKRQDDGPRLNSIDNLPFSDAIWTIKP